MFEYLYKTMGVLLGITIFLFLVTAIIGVFSYNEKSGFSFKDGDINSQNIIAVYKLNGPIINNSLYSIPRSTINIILPKDVKADLDKLILKKPKILIININTPGGTVSASEHLYKILDDFKKNNGIKIYFYVEDILASGGYWAATSSDKIFAKYGSIIGSIGVSGPKWIFYDSPTSISNGIFGQSIETENGIKVYSSEAGESKDLFNPFREPTKEEINHLKKMVDQIYEDFVNRVSQNRKLEINYLKNEIKSYVFNSKQAKENLLIDEVLTLDEVINYIVKKNNFKDYKIIEKKNSNNYFKNIFKVNFLENDRILCNHLNLSFISLLPNYILSC